MEWKMFEMKRRFGSTKEKVVKVFRLIRGLGKEDSNVSLPTPVITVASYEPVNTFTNYSLEAELKKAQALMYQHMLDRPK